ncbi:MAG: ATP-dependent Clp protease ATP-binding subunit ClpX, partial [Lachnospiraceae bacterium]|nr:ATP-dependent Clp protease ATP-binding subunit ClpX [Lachnospiraceae bacterium]
ICSICRRPESQAGKLVRMPMNMYICPDCMDKLSEMIDAQMGGMNGAGAIDWSKVMSMYNPSTMQMDSRMFNQDMIKNGAADPQKDGASATEKDDDPEAEKADDTEALKKSETDDPENKEQAKKPGNGIPKVSFVNFADLPFDFGFGGRQKVKKKEKGEHKPLIELKDIPAPHKIKAMLDEHVVGQEKAKKIMSVAVYNHYKRIATNTMDEIQIEKSNMLMLGPTGCGKTYLVQTLAKILNVPLAITDATSLTEAGYIGDDIESVVSKLLAAAGNDVDKAEQGIIYIDEIDKIAKKQNTNSRDVSGESVQQGMLKLLEGSDIEVPIGASSKNAMVPTTTVNTRNILFICGGAFPGIEEIIKNRLNKSGGIGFHAELADKDDQSKKIMQKVETEDIRKFGMIPEFVGRLPMVCALEGLDQEMMVRILKEPKNAILKQYQKLLALDEVKLNFADDALELIAEKAIKKETGARALRSILDEYMVDIMYEIPKDDNIGTVTITRDYLEGKGAPEIIVRGAE